MGQHSLPNTTDGCVSEQCGAALSATNSLSQGRMFAEMTAKYHGGRRTRRSHRRSSRKRAARSPTRRRARRAHRAQRGGAAEYPSSFDTLLPADMHQAADIASLDKAFSDLPQFAGKYGQVGGRSRRRQRGGVAPVDAPGMILPADMERAAALNPQWYTENVVNPNFQGPASPYAASQKGGRKSRRRHRKARRSSRNNRN